MLKRIEVERGKLISNSGYIAIWKYCFKIMLSTCFSRERRGFTRNFFTEKVKQLKIGVHEHGALTQK